MNAELKKMQTKWFRKGFKEVSFIVRTKSSNKKFFSENLLAIKMERTQIFMSTAVYLGLSVLEIIKKIMYDFRYDYVKSNMSKK